ncbi:MAG: diphosphomevalonate decarboxylase, partial [Pseudomonadota bacterium]
MEDAVEAIAHPNIALVKYWGKADVENNIPATPSLSITLDGFTSRTRISRSELPHGGSTDSVYLNGEATNDPKIGAFLRSFRRKHDVPPLLIDSRNNFPTASGLASSASGFAALVSAIDSCCELNLGAEQRSVWARRASASAARSVFGGFVTLNGPHWAAEPLLACDAWPLNVIVA